MRTSTVVSTLLVVTSFIVSACIPGLKRSEPSPIPSSEPSITTREPQPSGPGSPTLDPIRHIQIQQLESSAMQEGTDRLNRVNRLAKEMNIANKPKAKLIEVEPDQLQGIDYKIPVLRLRFSDMAFFNTNSAEFKRDSIEIIDLVAETIKRDMPDTQLLLMGHTDSRGTEEYNMNLSLRRAVVVMEALRDRGVRVSQMSALPIGELQPIQTNTTPKGMAQNRRVEFYISSNHAANITVAKTADFCPACINDHETNPKPVDHAGARAAVRALGEVRISDDLKAEVVTEAKTYSQVMDNTIETAAPKTIRSPLNKGPKIIRDY